MANDSGCGGLVALLIIGALGWSVWQHFDKQKHQAADTQAVAEDASGRIAAAEARIDNLERKVSDLESEVSELRARQP